MFEATFRSDMTVKVVDHMGSDRRIVQAAKVSTEGQRSFAESEAKAGFINFLMKNRHGSPFEHGSITFYIETPLFVMRELMRHRMASYNEESGRYKELEAVFYVPDEDRPLQQVGKTGNYEFVAGTSTQKSRVKHCITNNSLAAYARYQSMLRADVAKEVARMVLPVNLYSSVYVTMNPRALMNFLSLRVTAKHAAFPSFPQAEIEMVAKQMEEIFAAHFHLTHKTFVANGRVAP